METRQVVAWGIILFLIVMIGAAIRFGTTSKKRQRARERRAFDRRAASLTGEERR
jgi:Zn-dependent protease with chaperone function